MSRHHGQSVPDPDPDPDPGPGRAGGAGTGDAPRRRASLLMPRGLRGWLRTAFFAAWTWLAVSLLVFSAGGVAPPGWQRDASHAALLLLPLLTVTGFFFGWRLGAGFLVATLAVAAYVLFASNALPL